MSSISAGTTSGTALVSTADTTGALVLKTNGTTTALTLGADQTATFVGAVTAPSFSGTSSTATNLAGGSAGTVPYQSAINTTQMLAAGTSGQSLLSSGAGAPTWGTPALATAATSATTATNLAGGAASQIPYQTGSGATSFIANGTSGQVLTSNGASVPTWSTPAPGSGVVTAVASGSLANGATVILNSNGTVSAVAGSQIAESLGTRSAFKTDTIEWPDCCYDSVNNKVVIVYRDSTNSYYGTSVVGTVSGTTISFGTPVVFLTDSATRICCTFNITESKVVVFYRKGTDTYPYGVVGTVSGTSISFGSPTAVNSLSTEELSCTYDSTNNKVVVCHIAETAASGRAYVGTISGTSISFGTGVAFIATNAYKNTCCFDSYNGKVVIAFTDSSGGDYGTAIVGTVSGTSISFGTKVVFNSAITNNLDVCFDNVNNKIIVSYADSGNSSYGTAIVGTVGGSSITFGSEFVFNAGSTSYTSCIFSAKKVVIFYDGGGAGSGKVIVGSISGSILTFGTASTYNATSANRNNCCYDSTNNKCVNVYTNAGDAFGYAVVFQAPSVTSNLTVKNFIGFSSASYTNGQTATISAIGSITTAQSSLTTAELYYAQYDGTLATTVNAESPSPYAGVSLSATSLLIKG